MNSIRPVVVASPLVKGEAEKPWERPGRRSRGYRDSWLKPIRINANSGGRTTGAGWSRNVRKVRYMTQRDLSEGLTGSGVRGTIVAMKPDNAGGAKGSRKMEGTMAKRTEQPPAIVHQAQQAGAATPHPLWWIAKPCVWTTRMLTTLITGMGEQKWFRLFDKVFAERNLFAAFQQVAKNDGAPGVDHVSVAEFARQVPENIWQLSDALRDDTYRPQAIRRVHIPKPGTQETRPLGIPTMAAYCTSCNQR